MTCDVLCASLVNRGLSQDQQLFAGYDCEARQNEIAPDKRIFEVCCNSDSDSGCQLRLRRTSRKCQCMNSVQLNRSILPHL